MEGTNSSYDLIVIGGGPAGLSAAIYGGRAKLRTLLINKGAIGGMADTTREIVNYPGYINVGGPDLMSDFRKHAENLFDHETLPGMTDHRMTLQIINSPDIQKSMKQPGIPDINLWGFDQSLLNIGIVRFKTPDNKSLLQNIQIMLNCWC